MGGLTRARAPRLRVLLQEKVCTRSTIILAQQHAPQERYAGTTDMPLLHIEAQACQALIKQSQPAGIQLQADQGSQQHIRTGCTCSFLSLVRASSWLSSCCRVSLPAVPSLAATATLPSQSASWILGLFWSYLHTSARLSTIAGWPYLQSQPNTYGNNQVVQPRH